MLLLHDVWIFSISSHGENESEALASLSDCIKDYLDYAVNNSALDEIIDTDDEQFWKIYRELELKNESSRIVRNALTLKKRKNKRSNICLKHVSCGKL